MTMLAKQDTYSKGMAEFSEEEQLELTPELDLSQYRMIKPHLGKDILEVGAGSGRMAQLLLKDNLSYERYVISEPSKLFVERLETQVAPLGKCTVSLGETSDLVKQYPHAFDTIFSVHVLEHVENDRAFVEDCFMMLRPGGKLITLVPALQFLYSDFDRRIGHYRRYDKKMVRRLIEGLGFSICTMYYTNFLAIFPSLIVFKMRKLDFQENQAKKIRFLFLQRTYSKYLIPAIDLMERYITVPIGLNLTFVLEATGAT